jgi:hypothetical protein
MAADESRRVAALTETVDALARENQGLRQAGQLRALIEQAKGVLVERHGLSVDEAFDRLREISQSQNARLVNVAATIVGVSVREPEAIDVSEDALPAKLRATDATSAAWLAVRDHPRARNGAIDVSVAAIAESTTHGDEAARLLVDLLSSAGVKAALIFRAVADDSLQALGQHGYSADTISAWRRIPLSLDVPLTRAVNEGVPVFIRSTDDLVAQFPSLERSAGAYEAIAVVPVWDGDTRIGSLGFSWPDAQAFDEEQRQRVLSIARRAGSLMLRNLRAEDRDGTYLSSILHLLRDPWLVLTPDGEVDAASLTVESVSSEVKGGHHLLGQRLLAAFPGVAGDTQTLDELLRLARHGGRFVRTTQSAGVTTAPWDLEPGELRAVRAGRRVVLTWHPPDLER